MYNIILNTKEKKWYWEGVTSHKVTESNNLLYLSLQRIGGDMTERVAIRCDDLLYLDVFPEDEEEVDE